MVQTVFRGVIKAPGRFVPADVVRFHGWLRAHVGQKVEVVLREPQPQRSLEQNAYLYAVPLRLLADHTGHDVSEIKTAILGEHFGWVYSPLAKRDVPVKASTSELTVKEFDELIDWLPSWAMQHLGVVIPLPNEVVPR